MNEASKRVSEVAEEVAESLEPDEAHIAGMNIAYFAAMDKDGNELVRFNVPPFVVTPGELRFSDIVIRVV